MKNITPQTPNVNTKFETRKNRPEVRDNLDSRKNEEFDFKGDDVTHNAKEHRNNKPKEHK